jgi:uracil phosphoribosyltransferase
MGKQIHILDHPLLRHKLGYLRSQDTQSNEFRELTKEISKILAYEALREWKDFDQVEVQTPLAKTKVHRIVNPPVAVSIMRAGNGMLDAVLSMIPFASAGFIGIYRDKFVHSTVEYYFKMPQDIKGRVAILCDPLIATGDTIIAAIERLKSYEVKRIQVLNILISQSALARIEQLYPDVEIFSLNIEKEMNDEGYLVPGLGDAGDRLFQTK